MGESNEEQRPRASLRGRGREILFGKRASSAEETAPPDAPPPLPEKPGQVDPAALKLTPEESATLLNFSPDAPVYAAEVALPAPPVASPKNTPPDLPPVTPDPSVLAWMQQETGEPFQAGVLPVVELPPVAVEEVLEISPAHVRTAQPVETAWDDLDLILPDDTALGEMSQANLSVPMTDSVPLAEREFDLRPSPAPPYSPAPEIDSLVPQLPETWSGSATADFVAAAQPISALQPDQTGAGGVSGQTGSTELIETLPDPFGADAKPAKRPSGRALFGRTARADKDLLNLLVDDERIVKLSQQIEAMQEDLAQNVVGDLKTTDAYQKELLQASSLLLASRANYDDARAVVYRVRADVNRQRKVVADIRRYRPLLLNYYIGWGIALVVLFLLKSLFTGVTDAVGVGIASALYYPILLGIGGALIAGYLTLERHTTRLRDFDPLHISWYLFNPLMGSVMGLLMFLLASIANEDLLRETASGAENAIAYLLCVVGGMNQNHVLRQLNDLLRRMGRGGNNG
jgi:hypothetical protein